MYNIYIYGESVRDRIVKFLIIMKLSTLFLIIPLLQVSASANAQSITISKSNAALTEVFDEISRQTDYDFFYTKKQLSNAKKVNVTATNATITEVLDKCFEQQPFGYMISEKNISIVSRQVALPGQTRRLKAIDVGGVVQDEDGQPLVGATVKLKGSTVSVITGQKGEFTLANVDDKAILIVSFLGYDTMEIGANLDLTKIVLAPSITKLNQVEIVSTGYQLLRREQTTGSFVQIDNKLLNRSTSTHVLDRIKDLVPGIYFEPRDPQLRKIARFPNEKDAGIAVRGQSTINASKQPLIILDNFPYEGEISNINPNDIENITILKDASAAAIWGARSGNGVIVITSKKGRNTQKMKIDVNSNVTTVSRPDLKYDPAFLDAPDYIAVEQLLFDNGFFDNQLNNTSAFPNVSPAVELMSKIKTATTEPAKLGLQTQLEALKSNDIRNDYKKNVYQQALNQQYSIGIRGGERNVAYIISAGYDENKNSLVSNGYRRTSLNSSYTYTPLVNLELTAGLNYNRSNTALNNGFSYGTNLSIGNPYEKIYPYARLENESGETLGIAQGLRMSYLNDSRSLGFLDWNFRPLDEIKLADNTVKISDILFRLSGKYQIIPKLNIEISYQNERQAIVGRNYRDINTYYARNLINKFSTLTAPLGPVVYNFPKGGILDLENTEWNQQNLRGQISYNRDFGKHTIAVLAGLEGRELKTEGYNRTSYGYNDQFGTSTDNLNYSTYFPVNPSGFERIAAPSGLLSGFLNRYFSYYSAASYEYDNKYLFNVSGRKDGANLFGARINDKIEPLWAAGVGWNISNEDFFRINWINSLRVRTSYGYQGNTYDNGNAYLTGIYSVNGDTGAPVINVNTAPNPRLKWEKIRSVNFGLDFGFFQDRITGSIEIFQKMGQNLIQPTPLAPQTGFSTYQANTAGTMTNGVDIGLQSRNLSGAFSWNTSFILSTVKDKVVKYDEIRSSINSLTIGKPLTSVFTYKWAGLNPQNGNPQGYLNNQISEDYSAIQNNFAPETIVFKGSYTPTAFGALRNDFTYHGFSFSINISYRLGYVFKRQSTSTNYTDILLRGQHEDYKVRWKSPGDETATSVPSLVYPANASRDSFYQNSEILIESADHVRVQDVQVGYEFRGTLLKSIKLSRLKLFSYANNLGLLWTKNKYGLDPSAVGNGAVYPNPFSLSFGINANF
jgi:TonB-linked SusC/RagA family outer membrane protein